MPLTQLVPPYPIFTDRNGDPLDAGYLYFGEVNENPETNPIQVYWDVLFTQPVAQPIRTINGYPSRAGSPAAIYANSFFSVTVRNKRNELVIYSASGYGISPGTTASTTDQVMYSPGGTGAVPRILTSKQQDTVSVKDFGAVGDGVTDDSAAMTACANYCSSTGAAMYVPSGTYIVTFNAINPPLTQGKNFCIFGDGPTSILKGKDAVFTADFRHIIRLAPSSDIDRVEVRDLFIDNNARGSAPPPLPTSYQRSATILMAANPGFTQRSFSISNVMVKDPVADSIFVAHNATATLERCDIRNIVEVDRTRTRHTVTITRLPVDTTIQNIVGNSIQVEPTAPTQIMNMVIANCILKGTFVVDMASEGTIYPARLFVTSVTAPVNFAVAGAIVYVDNCRGGVLAGDGRSVSDCLDGSIISNTCFLLPYDSVANSITTFYPHYSLETVRGSITFNNCDFLINSIDDTITPTGYCIYSLSASSSATAWKRRYTLNNCRLDPRAEYGIYLYRNGYWQLNNLQYGGRVAAINVASAATRVVSAVINGGDFSRVTGAVMTGSFAIVDQVTNIAEIRMCGTWNNITTALVTNSGGNVTSSNYFVDNTRIVPVTALPSSAIAGDTLNLTATTLGAGKRYVCTTSSATVPVLRMSQQAGTKRDTTANRPAPNASDIGLQYLDTTLDADGKPIWWTGTAWVDATGLVV
jgi:hypothetical protein